MLKVSGRLDGETPPNREERPERRLIRRRQLPTGRAVIGGLLVAVAAVGTIALSRSGDPDQVPVLVAARLIEPGMALGPDNLEVAHMALPPELIDQTFGHVDDLGGTVARSRVEPGDLLQRGAVVQATAFQRLAAPTRELSLRLEPDRVVDGRLENGDRVDVLATYGTGADAFTTVVLRDAPVLHVQGSEGAIGSTRGVVVTLALTERSDTVALAHALDVAAVRIVRTTTAPADDTEVPPFRPDRDVSPAHPPSGEDHPA